MANRLCSAAARAVSASLPARSGSASAAGLSCGASPRLQQHLQQHRRSATSGGSGRAAAAASGPEAGAPAAQPEDSHLFQSILSGILAPYWENTPTAEAMVGALESSYPEACLAFDHFAFRTFGVDGLGIGSVASLFTDFGYQRRDRLVFPNKKLQAYWYAPPDPELPRVFISEIQVEQLSPQAQAVIRKYAGSPASAALLGKYGVMSSLLGCQPWATPTLEDFQLLAQESEYAAWVLVNGYALNHATISVHQLEGLSGGIAALNDFLQEQGFLLNGEGGLIKVSPDGGLLQSSTVADRVSYCFAGGETQLVPGSYVEWAERRVLPEFASLPAEEVREWHRRDGFEASSADLIFESTTLAAEREGQQQ